MIINTTPHNIVLLGAEVKTIEPSGLTIRLREELIDTGETIDGAPLRDKRITDLDNLPPKQEGVWYIVSSMVAQAVKRDDFIVPNTIRDSGGRVVGCDGFFRITE